MKITNTNNKYATNNKVTVPSEKLSNNKRGEDVDKLKLSDEHIVNKKLEEDGEDF